MKKIFLFISPLIAFFLGGFILSFSCNAQAMPTPSSDTFGTIINGNNSLSFSLFSNVDVLPINSNPVDIYRIIEDVAQDPLVIGSQLNLMGNNDYTVTDLTQSEIDSFSEEIPYLFDVNGNVVQWDDVYHLHYMNAMFHGDVYIDSNGNILTSDQNRTKTMFQLGIGGALLNVTDIANIYDDIALELGGLSYSYPLESDITPYSVYINVGYYWNASSKYAGYIFIPSGFIKGNTVYVKETSQLAIYTTNLSNIEYKQYYPGNSSNFISVSSGSYNIDNYTYSYKIIFSPLFSTDITNLSLVSYSDFLNNPVRQNYVFDRLNYSNNVAILNSDDVVSFKKIISLPSTKQLQFDDTYDYDYINQLEQLLNNTDSSPNELFDSSKSISENNYPLNIEVPSNIPNSSPSTLPFPSPNVNPDPVPMPDPLTAPSIGSDIGEVDPTELRSTIPVINNLLNRFPFSIPWDIYGLLSGLSVQRETPYINTTIHIPGIDYDWVLDYDLSDFNGIASLFRTLFLIAFILGLAYFSYDHFFGS